MNEPQWLNVREDLAWKYLSGVLLRLPPVLEAQLQRDSNLAFADYMVMAMLSDLPERTARMTAIADIAKMSQPRLTRIATKLEKLGYLSRETSAQDKRVVYAVLTERGMDALAEAAPEHVRTVRNNIFDRLSPEQVENLVDVLNTLLENPGSELAMPFAGSGTSGCIGTKDLDTQQTPEGHDGSYAGGLEYLR